MNMEITMEARAVLTPKLAIASRSYTPSYTSPQKPETTKKLKPQVRLDGSTSHSAVVDALSICKLRWLFLLDR